MTIDRILPAAAGVLVLASLALSHLHSPLWLCLTAAVGAGLLQAAVTGVCPMAMVLRQVGAAFR
ncbi:YgaP family membrane protein [Azospirillum picis]|uniref:Inner membrane protein YgaP-like transmembrane domain-containing protein n=1 Tax=Azospirillum picis TaxID=488438 RepID=A0ABU0MP88_9PROT|nr:DUF2892 domain-containing protein [Azospirillum picis]MBP2301454.1 hypothetical protein [Azospirillum picis]MDQ0535286.1 hypothetical protein [Azospirillum picis]